MNSLTVTVRHLILTSFVVDWALKIKYFICLSHSLTVSEQFISQRDVSFSPPYCQWTIWPSQWVEYRVFFFNARTPFTSSNKPQTISGITSSCPSETKAWRLQEDSSHDMKSKPTLNRAMDIIGEADQWTEDLLESKDTNIGGLFI